MTVDPLELLLFTTDTELARTAARAGVSGFIVDWESKGKADRQQGQDMQINTDTVADLAHLAEAVDRPVIVRINGWAGDMADEIECAIAHGAGGIMLPMAQSAAEVAGFLDRVAGRVRTIVQVETQGLVEDMAAFAALHWDAAYVGLHDLMLSRGAASMWEAVLDGTVERVFRTLAHRDVGFAGATVIGGGRPIRFTQLLQELARLGARLTFLRRSFSREIQDRDMVAEIAALQAAWAACHRRGPEAIETDRTILYADLQRLLEI